jgi:putative glutamine amidotransferase
VHHHGLMTRPLIGITSEMTAAGWGGRVREAQLLPASYGWAVERSGCVPVLLPSAPHHAADLAARLDGVVFSDGPDIANGAGQHDEAGQQDRARDAAEFALMRAAIMAGLPVLAIGRGMRVLNAVRGGSLTERRDGGADNGHSPGPATWIARDVRFSPDSRLGRVLGTSLTVSFASAPGGRDQAVDRLGSGVTAVAWADGQSVEAIELARHPFAIGTGWHPEQGDDLRIFEELRAAADSRSAAA